VPTMTATAAPATTDARRALLPWLGTGARLLLAVVWTWAAVAKMGDPAASVRAVRAYELLPEWLAVTLWVATPFPGLLQTPLDVLVERDPPVQQAGLVVIQAIWAVALLALAGSVRRRAERKLVVQGG